MTTSPRLTAGPTRSDLSRSQLIRLALAWPCLPDPANRLRWQGPGKRLSHHGFFCKMRRTVSCGVNGVAPVWTVSVTVSCVNGIMPAWTVSVPVSCVNGFVQALIVSMTATLALQLAAAMLACHARVTVSLTVCCCNGGVLSLTVCYCAVHDLP